MFSVITGALVLHQHHSHNPGEEHPPGYFSLGAVTKSESIQCEFTPLIFLSGAKRSRRKMHLLLMWRMYPVSAASPWYDLPFIFLHTLWEGASSAEQNVCFYCYCFVLFLQTSFFPFKNSLKADFMTAADLNLLLSEDLNQLVLIEALSIPFQSSESFYSEGCLALLVPLSLYAFRWAFLHYLMVCMCWSLRNSCEMAFHYLIIFAARSVRPAK